MLACTVLLAIAMELAQMMHKKRPHAYLPMPDHDPQGHRASARNWPGEVHEKMPKRNAVAMWQSIRKNEQRTLRAMGSMPQRPQRQLEKPQYLPDLGRDKGYIKGRQMFGAVFLMLNGVGASSCRVPNKKRVLRTGWLWSFFVDITFFTVHSDFPRCLCTFY